jgi:hypothetical protein
LVTFTEFGSPDGLAGRPSLIGVPRALGPAGLAAVHCGTTMDLVIPAMGPVAVGYTFEPEDGGTVQLPPVWRCGCGFQLDAGLGPAAYAPALSA